ncbi:MAG: vanadium-dependent haloperoxidase, partial [Flavobacterium sp.]
FAGKLNGFTGITADNKLIKNSNLSLSVILCVYKMSNKLLPSGYMMTKPADSLLKLAGKKGISAEVINNSTTLVNEVVKQLTQYINQDGFRNLSGKKRYTPVEGDAYWQPTAPAFMQALEPYWSTLRTFVIDSSRQFTPVTTAPYDSDTSSQFYKLMSEVYSIGNKLSTQQAEIAMFWDCNPFALQQIGHLEFGVKKISPGGHWMGITGIACKKAKKNLSQTVYIHTAVACTIADAFISCWDEKYRSNRIRPETAIKRLINPTWHPLLQTPPFPEYTSGHSVISTAAAEILTIFFGDKFTYTDDTEK